MILQELIYKEERHKKENVRRKHDYIPFIIELLKKVAEKGKLKALLDQ
jgi:ubiquitin carboxyl-terminal hydrolase L5